MKIKADQLNRDTLMGLMGPGFNVLVEDCLDSTNKELWAMGVSGAENGTLLIAGRQTKGKGRLGRSFLSEEGGLYMSLLLRPELSPRDTALITPLAALAVAEAIEKHTPNTATIKWVNDVYCGGKKVCGILTEAKIDPIALKTEFVVVGVGLNVYMPHGGFPGELKDIAGALVTDGTEENLLNSLAADIAKTISLYARKPFDKEKLCDYKKRCFVLGEDVRVFRGNESFDALAVDIDDSFGLTVRDGNGICHTLTSGEVSVRVKGGVR